LQRQYRRGSPRARPRPNFPLPKPGRLIYGEAVGDDLLNLLNVGTGIGYGIGVFWSERGRFRSRVGERPRSDAFHKQQAAIEGVFAQFQSLRVSR
jgi:hypothetical protein